LRRFWITAVLFAALAPRAESAPSRRVFGYLYSGAALTDVDWSLVTDVAFFNEPLGTTGSLTTTSWSQSGQTMVTTGHQHGVRVMLTVTLFNSSGGSEIATFLGSATAVQTGTQNIVNAVVANGADGVDLDFEFVPKAAKAEFASFVSGLATALHAAVPGSDVSVAVPGTAYPGYDLPGLSAAADTLMIMAYDFHYAGGPPGPVAPLADSSEWGAGSDTATIALFTAQVADTSRLLLGVPLYGYDYYTTSSAVPGTKTAGTAATAVTWKAAEPLAAMYGRLWDSASSTPYYVYQDAGGQWRQTFYEDAQSLGLKLDLVLSSGFGGIGLWELSYASASFWSVIDAKLGTAASDGGADAASAPLDGGAQDQGPADGGPGVGASDGGPDAGAARDAGPRPSGVESGCGILSHPPSSAPWPLMLAIAALLQRGSWRPRASRSSKGSTARKPRRAG
jgi:spore germination protein YaaH